MYIDVENFLPAKKRCLGEQGACARQEDKYQKKIRLLFGQSYEEGKRLRIQCFSLCYDGAHSRIYWIYSSQGNFAPNSLPMVNVIFPLYHPALHCLMKLSLKWAVLMNQIGSHHYTVKAKKLFKYGPYHLWSYTITLILVCVATSFREAHVCSSFEMVRSSYLFWALLERCYYESCENMSGGFTSISNANCLNMRAPPLSLTIL